MFILDHYNIKAPSLQLEEIKHFYLDVLGLEVGSRPNFSFHGYWLYAGNRAILHLSVDEQRLPNEQPSQLDHIALRCEDIKPLIIRLQTANIDYTIKKVPSTVLGQLFFYDPAGIRIEINYPL